MSHFFNLCKIKSSYREVLSKHPSIKFLDFLFPEKRRTKTRLERNKKKKEEENRKKGGREIKNEVRGYADILKRF